jgi:hypothetical protein
LPATNAKRLRKGAQATKQSSFIHAKLDCFAYARNDDTRTTCFSLAIAGLDPAIHLFEE